MSLIVLMLSVPGNIYKQKGVIFIMRKIGDCKKGQQLTLGTVILIVLGIAVLVFLIFGFSTGWSNLWDRITNFAGGSGNLDTVRQGCELACASNNVQDYCALNRTVKFNEEIEYGGEEVTKIQITCEKASGDSVLRTKGLSVESCPRLC